MRFSHVCLLGMALFAADAKAGQFSQSLSLNVVDASTGQGILQFRHKSIDEVAPGEVLHGPWRSGTTAQVSSATKWIVVEADGYIDRTLSSRDWSGTSQVSVAMEPAVSLEGSAVETSTLRPIPNASGSVAYGEGTRRIVAFTADATGSWSVHVPRGPVKVILRADRYSMTSVRIVAPASGRVIVPLAAAAFVSGTVLMPGGVPAPRGTVRLRPVRSEALVLDARVRADGRFEFRNVPTQRDLEAIAQVPGCQLSRGARIALRPGELVTDLVLQLESCN